MEEVDQIIIHQLRQLGCDIEDDVNGLEDLPVETTVKGVIEYLNVIAPDSKVPSQVPGNMVARYNLGMQLAQIFSELGYKGDIGYQSFMYSNNVEMRRIFTFLIEKMPKETQKTVIVDDEPTSPSSSFGARYRDKVSWHLQQNWLPSYCKRDQLRHRGRGQWVREGTSTCKPLRTAEVSLKDCDVSRVFPTLLEMNALCLQSSTSTTNSCLESQLELRRLMENAQSPKTESVAHAGEASTLETTAKSRDLPEVDDVTSLTGSEALTQETELERLRAEMHDLSAKFETADAEHQKITALSAQLAEEIARRREKTETMSRESRISRKALELMENAEENVNKLNAHIENLQRKQVLLAEQWEEHRGPLMEEYRQLRAAASKRTSEAQHLEEEIRWLGEKKRQLGDDYRNKLQLRETLLKELEHIQKDVSRSACTRRILEIISSIKKQKQQIDSVLEDTRKLQKEINSLSGKLDRTFRFTEELVFKDAKKDDYARRTYKYLAQLHEDFRHLLEAVEQTGVMQRESRDLEEQIDREQAKQISDNLQRITADYKQMKLENAQLIQRLQSSNSQS